MRSGENDLRSKAMTGACRNWDTTRLWLELKRREELAERERSVLLSCMPSISAVLHDSGSGIEDFTLHDEGHAFRVAERMVDILPPGLLHQLGTIEVALLLFAAYLHDIGMSPGRARRARARRRASQLSSHRELGRVQSRDFGC